MVSDKFRQQLKKEVEKWQAEGLIDSSVVQQLRQRYQLNSLEAESQNRFILVLLGLGGILLGLGMITFVAANWQGWSREVRVILLLGLFLGVNFAGFVGWSSSQPQWQRLGKALLLLGSLLLGANLALMSQMFHHSGEVYELYLVWGGGVLAMAYGVRLTWLAIVAIALVGIGYWSSFPTIFEVNAIGAFDHLRLYMPLLTLILFIPLAKICHSRWVFVWGMVAVVSSLEATLIGQLPAVWEYSPWLAGGIITLAISLPPLLLWGYDAGFGDRTVSPHSVTRRLSVLFLAGVCYLFSFYRIWQVDTILDDSSELTIEAGGILLQVFIFVSFTLYSWWRLGFHSDRAFWRLTFMSMLVAVMSLVAGGIVGLSVGGVSFADFAFLPTTIYNLMLFISAIALIRQGLNQGNRLNFWLGLGLLSLQIFSRMFEYQTGLIFKSIILILCGLGVVIAGLWFERYRRFTISNE